MKLFTGIPISSGIIIGPLYRYEKVDMVIPHYEIKEFESEIQRFTNALRTTSDQLEGFYKKLLKQTTKENAEIFHAQKLMLEDVEYLTAVHKEIREGKNAEAAVENSLNSFLCLFGDISNEYIRDRANDLKDVTNRLLRNLLGLSVDTGSPVEPSIIFAEDLSPADTVHFDRKKLLGFCTKRGGTTSHTAILARNLGIPAVAGINEDIQFESGEHKVILDGNKGVVYLDPSDEIQKQYNKIRSEYQLFLKAVKNKSNEPAITVDGRLVQVAGNIGRSNDAANVKKLGGEGIGLFRTEFLYLDSKELPTEEEQFIAYKKVFQSFDGYPVIFRTLDIGGDKQLPAIHIPKEDNPFLGQRAIRLSFKYPELFNTQIRAILRATNGPNAKIMLPMVSSRDEIVRAKGMIRSCQKELDNQNITYNKEINIGIMIEIPSAALIADKLVDLVDFFSIGTNDLSQYTFAADRTNPEVSPLADCLHPSVLKLVKMVVNTAHKHGKWVGVCGEMASDPLSAIILIGLGVDELSMNPPSIPIIKNVIRNACYSEAQKISKRALRKNDSDEVRNYLSKKYLLNNYVMQN